MTETIHAARSPEFLSRLYDGEVGSSERAAFEAHRSGCEECRRASDTFAATLAAFRASPTAPPAADLSARILRKIRAQSPSRRPFGVMFGIDVRWAGVLAAALVVVLLSAPLLLRRKGSVPAAPTAAINARILDATATRQVAKEKPANEPPRPVAAADAPAPPGSPVRADGSEARAGSSPAPAAGAENEAKRFAPQGTEAKDVAPALRRRVSSAEHGTELGAANAADAFASLPRFSVRPADGGGPAPDVVSRPPDERLAALRGQTFLIVVEAGGRVSEVRSSAERDRLSKTEAPEAGAPRGGGPSDALLALRFAPGERPRRLLVVIE